MKICLINNLYLPDTRGGAEHIVERTVNGLQEQGHTIVIITTRRKTDQKRVQRIHGVTVYKISSRNLGSFYSYNEKPLWFRLLWLMIDIVNAFVARDVGEIIDQEKPDIVHTHNLRGLSYLVPRIIKQRNIKHVHTLHDIQYIYPSGLLIKGEEKSFINTFFLRKWYEKLCRVLLDSPDTVISPSKWLLEFYTGRGFFRKSKKEVLRNPVQEGKGERRKQKGEENTDKTVCLLFVGQIERHKGILFLLRTFKTFQLPLFNFHLDIVGDGSCLQEAKQIAKDNQDITFHGRVPHGELSKFYQRADIVVVPSLTYENTPSVILEAFEYGVPVLASNIGGIGELIEEGKNGWLFEANHEQSLLEVLPKVIVNKDVPGEMRLNNSNILSAKEHVNQLINIYKKIDFI